MIGEAPGTSPGATAGVLMPSAGICASEPGYGESGGRSARRVAFAAVSLRLRTGRNQTWPPALGMAWPLTLSEPGSQSQSAADATSSVRISRLWRLSLKSDSAASSLGMLFRREISSTLRSRIAVSTYPGQSALTVMPVPLCSSDRTRSRPTSPCFETV